MAVSISQPITYKRLAAVANDGFWFEDRNVAGTMLELAPSDSDVDTSDNLNIFEAYQKVFVVNGTKLKVADFKNTQLTHTALTTAHAHGDILTQASSTASMVVDYTSADKKQTYGYTTTGVWDFSNSVTGSGSGTAFTPTGKAGVFTHAVLATAHAADDVLTQAGSSATMTVIATDTTKTHTYGTITANTWNTTGQATGSGSGTAFTPTVVNLIPPVWYDYTVYPGGSSGSLPARAYIGCLYQGRVVLSGNPNYPNQWYMSRQTNPWDYAYVTGDTDAQSPVYGGASDAGECGDIVRALIPYRDEYLVFGCATSMWYLTGNPAQGGQILELDLTVGIFGANSYCFDGGGNLYFWGTNGLYKTTMPRQPRCVSARSLPSIVRDEDADASTHRITMAYDRTRSGISVCITKLSDGTNSNYFYDKATETDTEPGGFFPETYPEECGAYSLFYYSANDAANRDLLLGCKDGYLRKFDPTAEDDDIGGTDEAIDSYVSFGPLKLGGKNKEGVISSIVGVTAGGKSSSELTDSSSPTLNVWVGHSADEITEKLIANSSPNLAATISAPGRNRGAAIKRPVRGAFAGIRVGNSTATETWGLERLILEGVETGRMK